MPENLQIVSKGTSSSHCSAADELQVEAEPASGDGARPESSPQRGRQWGSDLLMTVAVAVVLSVGVWYFGQFGPAPISESVTVTARASGPAPRIGQEAPDFRLAGMDGEMIQLSDFRGQPVWINFWATWCPPCRAEMPEIEAAHQRYKDTGLVILAVNLGESPDIVRAYLAKTGLTFLVLLDRSEQVAAEYRLLGLPSHYFIDADGTLRESRIGAMDKNMMDDKIRALLDLEAPE